MRTERMKIHSSRTLKNDKSALSSLITVTGIIALILTFVIAPILTVYVPIWTKDAEAEHMEDTADAFSMLRSNINNMIERDKLGTNSNVRLDLGARLNNIMLPDSSGTLYLNPDHPDISIFSAENNMDLYARSTGSIEYKANNHEFTDQRYVYENGGVIAEHKGKSNMNLLPDFDIGGYTIGKTLLSDTNIYGNLPGYDTSHPNAVYYNLSSISSDVSITYDIYNNNQHVSKTDFDESGDISILEERKNDWFIESELDRTNIIAKWCFSETGSSVYDEASSSLSTHEGSLLGSASRTAGKFGSGIEFTASSKSRITVANTADLQLTGSHTLEAWLYPHSTTGSMYAISKLKESASSGYALMIDNGEIKYILGDGTGMNTLYSSGANIQPYAWTHIAGTWDGSTMYVYANGEEVGTKSFSGTLASNSFKLVMGSNQDENGNFFDGILDEVILTSSAKSSFVLDDGILSVRGDVGSNPDDCLALFDYLANWVEPQNNTDWKYRKKINIKSSQVEDDLYNFPALIKTTDLNLKSKARSDGYDIVFTEVDGVTRLDHEIENFNGNTGALTAWVRIPELSSTTDTPIYMYYGNSAITSSTEDPEGVWKPNHVGVWHLKESPSGLAGEIKDSTSNNNDGKTEGSMNSDDSVDAKIDKGLDFDETDDLIRIPDSTSLDSVNDKATLSLWIWWDDSEDGNHQNIMSSSNRFTSGMNDGYEWASQGDGDHFFYPWGGDSNNYNLGANPFTDKTWHHLAVTQDYSSKDVKIYVDGNAMTFTTTNVPTRWTSLSSSNDWLWGGNPDRSERYFDGMFDEIHVSDIVRSSAWIKTEYNNQNNPGSFISKTGEENIYAVADHDIGEPQVGAGGNLFYRKKITIKASEVYADLPNFPVLIDITDNDLKNRARSDGYDIVFSDSNAANKLDHEIESYDSSTGELTAWVEIPSLSSTIDTVIYMYYGDSSISSPSENPEGVWDTNFTGVWHLGEEQSGTGNSALYKDSTSNDNDGDDYVSATGQSGQINGGQEFDGSGDYIEVPHDDGLNIKGPMTISFWINPTKNTSTFNRIVEKGTWGYQTSYYFGCGNGQNDLTFYLSNNEVFDTANEVISLNTWQHAAVSYDSSGNAFLLVDGVQEATGSYSGSITGNTGTLHISYSSSDYDFPGYIDEVRISNLARSSNWLKTEYNNQNNPGNFITMTGEENIYASTDYDIGKPKSGGNIFYRKKITFKASEVSSDLTDFPVLIKLTDSDVKKRARTDGHDIFFTESNGETLLDFERESYDSSTGSIVAWVRIPSLSSSSDTVIYMHYGDLYSSDQSNPEGVWNSDYKAVWHLKDDPSGTAPQIIDSTSNSNDGTSLGSMSSSDQVTGKIDGSIDLDGSDDKMNIPADSSINVDGNATISGWFKVPSDHSSTSKSKILIEKYISNDYDFAVTLAGRDFSYSSIPQGSIVFKTENKNKESGVRYKYTSQTTWTADTWYYFVCVVDAYNNTNNNIYINSVSDVGGNVGGSTKADLSFDTDWQIGGGNVDTANIWTGVNHSQATLDEFRISKGIRSAAWIETEYKNQNNPGNFYTVGGEELIYDNRSALTLEVKALGNEYFSYSNAFIVFDYQSDTDFKYAGMRVYDDKWVIGHYKTSGYDRLAYKSETINTNTWYDLKLVLDQNNVSLYADGSFKINYTFSNLGWGKFGLANEKAHSHFDDFKIYYNLKNGIQIWVNNNFYSLAKSSEINDWEGPYDKLIPNEWLNLDKPNSIKFKNTYSSSKIWAVRNVIIRGNPKELTVSMITLECEQRSVSGSGSHVIHTKLVRKETREYDLGISNVTLEITTKYYDAWFSYLNDRLNQSDSGLEWDSDRSKTDYYLWSTPGAGGTRTIYLTFNRLEMLTCIIAVVEVTLD